MDTIQPTNVLPHLQIAIVIGRKLGQAFHAAIQANECRVLFLATFFNLIDSEVYNYLNH